MGGCPFYNENEPNADESFIKKKKEKPLFISSLMAGPLSFQFQGFILFETKK